MEIREAITESACSGVERVLPRRILVVEDDDGVREVIAALLRAAGVHEVACAKDGSAALALLSTGDEGPPGAVFDVAIVDAALPGGRTGVDLAREIRARRAAVGIVVITGYPEWLETARRSGCADACLPKPFGVIELQQAIAHALDLAKRSFEDENV
jgi:CheY-like chemotaxis protein